MARMQEHMVGGVVAERFELLVRMGVDGTGTVWRARDLVGRIPPGEHLRE